jgi:hypothetical protein
MYNVRDRMQVEASSLGDTDSTSVLLATCNPKKFKQSKLEFVNHLRPLKGCSGVSLAYVIRDDTLDPATAVDDDERV